MDLKLQQETTEAEAKQWQEDCIREVIQYFLCFLILIGTLICLSSFASP